MKTDYKTISMNTPLGAIRGLDNGRCYEFRGVPFAKAGRFEYARPVESWDGELDATAFGPGCPQNRAVHEHLENPTRRFYKREFRDGMDFRYEEDCLDLNIYTPKDAKNCPVILFFHGGGFNSGSNNEEPFRGYELAKRGIVTVFANYRVGVLGYFAHEEIRKREGRDGNFGLDDILLSIRWVKAHIASFGGDPENITVMGQSAGAVSLQYLCLSKKAAGLFKRAVLISGGGLFPKAGRPKPCEDTRAYWKTVMELAGAESFEAFCRMDEKTILTAVEEIKKVRKDNTSNTQPVVDGYLLEQDTAVLIKDPLPVDYMLGTTSRDMFNIILYHMAWKFGKQTGAYRYFFDIDAPGDENGAFHSSDLRYFFGTLDQSFRPYDAKDREVSELMMDYVADFVRCGDPNREGRPRWDKWDKKGKPLNITKKGIGQKRPDPIKLLFNTFRGDPK